MRILKASMAVVIAVIAVGFTLASHAGSFGEKAIADCYRGISLKNAAGTISNVLNVDDAHATALSKISTTPYVQAVPAGVVESSACPAEDKFCCIKLKQTTNPAAPILTIGGVTGRFELDPNQVFWKD